MENCHAPHRRRLHLQGYDYSQSGAYFVTLCTQGKKCLLGAVANGEIQLSAYGKIVADSWKWLSSRYPYVELDAWVIMPNHLHGIIFIDHECSRGCFKGGPCRGGSRAAPTAAIFKIKTLGSLIGAFKTVSTKKMNMRIKVPEMPFWQRGFFDHIVRNDESLNHIRQYIATNPLRWGLDRENPNPIGEDDFDIWMARSSHLLPDKD